MKSLIRTVWFSCWALLSFAIARTTPENFDWICGWVGALIAFGFVTEFEKRFWLNN